MDQKKNDVECSVSILICLLILFKYNVSEFLFIAIPEKPTSKGVDDGKVHINTVGESVL